MLLGGSFWAEAFGAGALAAEEAGAYERETVSKPLPNWGKFAICYRNFRSQRKEYGR
jgi:hypothetical protein